MDMAPRQMWNPLSCRNGLFKGAISDAILYILEAVINTMVKSHLRKQRVYFILQLKSIAGNQARAPAGTWRQELKQRS